MRVGCRRAAGVLFGGVCSMFFDRLVGVVAHAYRQVIIRSVRSRLLVRRPRKLSAIHARKRVWLCGVRATYVGTFFVGSWQGSAVPLVSRLVAEDFPRSGLFSTC